MFVPSAHFSRVWFWAGRSHVCMNVCHVCVMYMYLFVILSDGVRDETDEEGERERVREDSASKGKR